ncbi:hypothetical protein C1645_823141 [Glomus cerebriforme]|uniref:Uncharacterized protein n=1 Tax=Glomus cerebriforme TaxID=658196 RepID=A0A397SX31_9GLOM|nr:hypothetical protein C1645_823141 [Glomus cerebriforme]
MSSHFNSVYAHNHPSTLALPTTSIFTRQASTTSYNPLNTSSHTTSTSPYYHHIQPPPLAVLEHQSHQTMSQKGNLPTSQWSPDNRMNMFNPGSSPFTPYQSSNGPSKFKTKN